ncbi:MAG: RsmE family RNA methyltransferase [bacterium]
MRRLYVPNIGGGRVILRGEVAHRVGDVLRLRPGDRIILFDGRGHDYESEIVSVARGLVECAILGKTKGCGKELRNRIALLQGLPRGDKMATIVEMSTEMGVHRIIAFASGRSIARATNPESRLERWCRIATSAAEVAERGIVPQISLLPFRDALKEVANCDVKMICWEEEREKGIMDLLRPVKGGDAPLEVAVCVGPEGGFSQDEVDEAANLGFKTVSLGPRKMRAETAAVVAVASVMFALGEI